MTDTLWIADALEDIARFCEENGMNKTALSLRVARGEIVDDKYSKSQKDSTQQRRLKAETKD